MQILCATDFSKAALDAADVAAAIAKKFGFPLRLIYCAEDWVEMGELAAGMSDDALAREPLNTEAQRLRETGVEVIAELRAGNAGIELASASKEAGIMLLVVGPVAEIFPSASVAEFAAMAASVPTLIVRDAAPLLAWLRQETSLAVVCGVDFTLASDAALAFLTQLLPLGRLDLTAAYISPSRGYRDTAAIEHDFDRDIWERLRVVLGDVPAMVDAPVNILIKVAVDRPHEELVRIADEQKAGLIVVGRHHRMGWRRLLRPSFSRAAVVHAETNVLCVPTASFKPPFRAPATERVLVATDFSEGGNDAVRYAYSLLSNGGEVCLLHVCLSPASSFALAVANETRGNFGQEAQSTKDTAAKMLADLQPKDLATSAITTTTEVLIHDNAAAAINEFANVWGADVICLGTTGHSRARIALLGSTVQAVIARSHTPVFVVPQAH